VAGEREREGEARAKSVETQRTAKRFFEWEGVRAISCRYMHQLTEIWVDSAKGLEENRTMGLSRSEPSALAEVANYKRKAVDERAGE